MYNEEKKRFESLVRTFVPYLNNRTKAIIEFYVCILAFNEQPIFQISHKDDPPYDHSGKLVRTDEYLTLNSEYTIKEIMEMFTGDSEPSYCSGYGMFHIIHEEECQDLIDRFLNDFTNKLVEECIKHKLFLRYFDRHFDEDYEFEENVEDFASEFSTNFFYSYHNTQWLYPFRVEDKIKDKFGEQTLKSVYEKYNTYIYSYKKKFAQCKKHNDEVLNKYKAIVDSIVIYDQFKTKIERRTKVWEDLKRTYTKEELSMLFKFNKLYASDSITKYYENMFNESVKDKIVPYPDKYKFLYKDINATILYNLKFA